jgi:hypothetical protein
MDVFQAMNKAMALCAHWLTHVEARTRVTKL